jgi:type III secretion system FlhB-like substrate exporter
MAGALPRRAIAGRASADPVAGAAVVILGDDVAAAIAWHPTRRPVPTCTAVGHGAQATRLVGLARRHGIAVHREAELAAELRTGAVHESRWPRLAEIIAAHRR